MTLQIKFENKKLNNFHLCNIGLNPILTNSFTNLNINIRLICLLVCRGNGKYCVSRFDDTFNETQT